MLAFGRDRWGRRVLAVARRNQSRGTFVLRTAAMHLIVQTWRTAQRDRRQKSNQNSESNEGARPHWRAVCPQRGPAASANAPLDRRRALRYESRLEMIGAAKIYFLVFGVLTIAGGIMGYVKAGSVISIVAGVISGLLLVAAALLLPQQLMAGLIIAAAVSLLLAAQFVPKFLRTGSAMPAGLMSALSVIGIIVVVAAWLRK
jgi:uncharacterized membrane protein (UPF0136 family)